MIRDSPLEYVDDPWPVFVVVKWAEDPSGLDGHRAHSKLAPRHALDLGTKVERREQLRRDTFRFRCDPFLAYRAPLSGA